MPDQSGGMSLARPLPIADTIHRGRVIDHRNGYDVIACTTCGFRHVVPLPSPEAQAEEYAENYYTGEKPDYLKHAAEDAEWLKLMHRDRLEIIRGHLPGSIQTPTLIDIGCGPGFFLDAARELGFAAHGIEPSRQASAFARERGHSITNAMFDAQLAATLAQADAVTMTNVLEHVADPAALLEAAITCLRPGGILMVAVPNDYSPLQLAARDGMGMAPWWIAPPHHLNYFDFASLSALCARLGQELLEATTNFPMELFLLMGDDYSRDGTLGRVLHGKRKSVDLALERAGLAHVRQRLYAALAGAGIGREAVVISRKPIH